MKFTVVALNLFKFGEMRFLKALVMSLGGPVAETGNGRIAPSPKFSNYWYLANKVSGALQPTPRFI